MGRCNTCGKLCSSAPEYPEEQCNKCWEKAYNTFIKRTIQYKEKGELHEATFSYPSSATWDNVLIVLKRRNPTWEIL